MRKIKTAMLMSLDGVVQADGDWQFAYFDEQLFAWLSSTWESADLALIGRRSFEGYDRLHQEFPESPMLAFLERADRYVVTRSPYTPTWSGTSVIQEDHARSIGALREATGTDILVPGSPTLVRRLLGWELLDELNLIMLPVIVGAGDRLFPADDTNASTISGLRLSFGSSTPLASGALVLQYLAARP